MNDLLVIFGALVLSVFGSLPYTRCRVGDESEGDSERSLFDNLRCGDFWRDVEGVGKLMVALRGAVQGVAVR
jgi:hypothetical protein